jgi:hypothetical protein
MLPIATALFLISATPTALFYGGDATLAAEVAGELQPQPWRVIPSEKPAPAPTEHPGRQLYLQGRKAYEELLFEEAVPALRKAVERMTSTELTPEQWRDYLDAMLYLALTYEAIGSTDEADAALDSLAPYILDAGIADAKFPPPFRQKVAERLENKPVKTGALRIDSTPSGAAIFLNGQAIGNTPHLMEKLPGVRHTVTLSYPGFRTYTRQVKVQAGFGIGAEATPEWVKATLAPLESPALVTMAATLQRQQLPTPAAAAPFLQTAAAAAARMSFFLTRAPGAVAVAALHADGSWRGPMLFSADALDVPPRRAQLVKQLAFWTKQESPVTPAQTALQKDEAPTRWWLWTGLGVLVAGGATAAAVAAQPDRPAPSTGEVVIGW